MTLPTVVARESLLVHVATVRVLVATEALAVAVVAQARLVAGAVGAVGATPAGPHVARDVDATAPGLARSEAAVVLATDGATALRGAALPAEAPVAGRARGAGVDGPSTCVPAASIDLHRTAVAATHQHHHAEPSHLATVLAAVGLMADPQRFRCHP